MIVSDFYCFCVPLSILHVSENMKCAITAPVCHPLCLPIFYVSVLPLITPCLMSHSYELWVIPFGKFCKIVDLGRVFRKGCKTLQQAALIDKDYHKKKTISGTSWSTDVLPPLSFTTQKVPKVKNNLPCFLSCVYYICNCNALISTQRSMKMNIIYTVWENAADVFSRGWCDSSETNHLFVNTFSQNHHYCI